MSGNMKASCKSPANIAFIKYWGKTDPETRVPQNNSISMCLSNLYSICTVKFDEKYAEDEVQFLNEKVVKDREIKRIIETLDRVRNKAGISYKAKVVTKNNFPKATGIASSASGLSSLTVAAAKAAGLDLNKKEMSKLARLASGTACRSIPDGFVEWEKGTCKKDSYAKQIYPTDYWDIVDIVAIVTKKMKKISSTNGHSMADTSPFQETRIKNMPEKIKRFKKTLEKKDFYEFGNILEKESLNMHAICLTSKPPILYWEATTMTIMRKVREWRSKGLPVYFTIDAGPSVHIICKGKSAEIVQEKLKKIKGIDRISLNRSAKGAKIIKKHLF